MCGIVGYTGPRQAAPLLLEGLKRLEYRGYDSAGLALVADGRIEVHRAPGKISVLEKELGTTLPPGHTGIAHTRWATHGAPNTVNAHPHTDCGGTLALIHNGIIENAGVLRAALVKRGHVFRSETDTEVLAHLIEELLANGVALVEAVAGALHQVEGTYGIAVVSTREPETIVAARRGSSRSGRGRTSWPRTRRPCWPTHARSCTWTTARSRSCGPRTTASSIWSRWRRRRRSPGWTGIWRQSSAAATPTSCSRRSWSSPRACGTRCAAACWKRTGPRSSAG